MLGPLILKNAGYGIEENDDVYMLMIVLISILGVATFICIKISGKYGRRDLMLKCLPMMVVAYLMLSISQVFYYLLDS
jgi:VIT1/CCC1 family predicted Fe2+/Mn2+ transporter